MAVASVVTWKINPARAVDFVAKVGQAKKIHERLGGQVEVWQNQIGGEPMTAIYVVRHESMSAFAAFSDAMAADTEWQEFWLRTLAGEPSATMVSSGLIGEMPGLLGRRHRGSGGPVYEVMLPPARPGGASPRRNIVPGRHS